MAKDYDKMHVGSTNIGIWECSSGSLFVFALYTYLKLLFWKEHTHTWLKKLEVYRSLQKTPDSTYQAYTACPWLPPFTSLTLNPALCPDSNLVLRAHVCPCCSLSPEDFSCRYQGSSFPHLLQIVIQLSPSLASLCNIASSPSPLPPIYMVPGT